MRWGCEGLPGFPSSPSPPVEKIGEVEEPGRVLLLPTYCKLKQVISSFYFFFFPQAPSLHAPPDPRARGVCGELCALSQLSIAPLLVPSSCDANANAPARPTSYTTCQAERRPDDEAAAMLSSRHTHTHTKNRSRLESIKVRLKSREGPMNQSRQELHHSHLRQSFGFVCGLF